MKSEAPYIAQLSDVELLAKLIGTNESRRLYRGSLAPLFAESLDGNGSHDICAVAKELVRRWLNEELRRDCSLTTPGSVRDYLRLVFNGREYESFVVLFLDAQTRLIVAKELFRGTLTQTSVYPREIVKEALQQNAAAVILAHNHPSGDPTPSEADLSMTKEIQKGCKYLGLTLHDHIIVGAGTELSLRGLGKI